MLSCDYLSFVRLSLKSRHEFSIIACVSLDLDSFPVMVRQAGDSERRAGARRSTEYVHDTEIIFILPALQMHLKTEHLQGQQEPLDDGTKTCVSYLRYFFVCCAVHL